MSVEEIATLSQRPPAEKSRPRSPRSWAANVVGIGATLAFCYYGEGVLVVMLVSVLLAFILAPVVDLLSYLRIPRGLGAAVAILLLIAVMAGVVYFSYNQVTNLLVDLPKYSSKIRDEILQFRKKAESFEVLNPQHERGVVNFRQAPDWTGILTRGFGSVSQVIFAVSFIPFLSYFMLTWQHHVRSATVMLFPLENRQTAYVTLGLISSMIRSFMVGNLLIGILIGGLSTVAFWILHVPFFYVAGFLSGFLSLIPYLGVLLAMAPPVFLSVGHLDSQDVLSLIVIVVGLHLIALNVLYPKFLGNRLQLNPLAVTMALLLWAWLWGGVGLLLAIPITAAMKIVFDHVETLKPYGSWLGE